MRVLEREVDVLSVSYVGKPPQPWTRSKGWTP